MSILGSLTPTMTASAIYGTLLALSTGFTTKVHCPYNTRAVESGLFLPLTFSDPKVASSYAKMNVNFLKTTLGGNDIYC